MKDTLYENDVVKYFVTKLAKAVTQEDHNAAEMQLLMIIDSIKIYSSNRASCIYEKGDIIASHGDRRTLLITGHQVNESGISEYTYINLKEYTIEDCLGKKSTIKKGDSGSQPCCIVNKYFALKDV